MGITKAETFEPIIYVAYLAAYNSGILHGRLIDAEQDADAIRDEIADMLKTAWSADFLPHMPYGSERLQQSRSDTPQ